MKIVLALYSAATAVLLYSCSEPIDPGSCNRPECLPSLGGLSVFTNILRTADSTVASVYAEARFITTDTVMGEITTRTAAAGVVQINGDTLRLEKINENIIYQADSSLILATEGQWNILSVSGYNRIPKFRDSILTPANPEILFPTEHDSVYRSTGFTLRYATSSLEGIIEITLQQYIAGSAPHSTRLIAPDTGSITITPKQLNDAGFTPGRLAVIVYRSTYRPVFIGSAYQLELSFGRQETVETIIAE